MDEPRSAQRYLEDLTPGGSEYFDNPKRCYEWASGRIEAAHRIAMEAALERNRQRERADALEAEVGRLRASLEWYADISHYDDSGCPGRLVGGGWAGTEPQEADWDTDYGEHARKTLGLPNPWEWPAYMRIDYIATCPGCTDLLASHYAGGCMIQGCTCRRDWVLLAAQASAEAAPFRAALAE